ncbi:MAG TPA: FAD-binding protein [Gammaproteobacteria bacterium]|nr:FAD-binding protein [Gammaproteobacteria bacterium]
MSPRRPSGWWGPWMTEPVEIAGAGPAGLAAAICLARRGLPVVVYERRAEVGGRFHGDFQGLENWTSREDVLDVLAGWGICPDFGLIPCRELVVFDPHGRDHLCRSREPMFYLLRRGSGPGTLDQGLKAQALQAGVDIRFQQSAPLLDRGIVAAGPRHSNVIAVGYVFQTDAADGVYAVASDTLAPKGYGYLLVHGGEGVVATCLFRDFTRQRECLARTVAFFERHVGLSMRRPRFYGGAGFFGPAAPLTPPGLLRVGEAAGFQDALFGFGIRYAMHSGVQAARALRDGQPAAYGRWAEGVLQGYFRTAVVNRYFYERLGNGGYSGFLRGVAAARDVRVWLRRYYQPAWHKSLLYPWARRRVALLDPA